MLGQKWEQNRELILELGTKEYQKPAQLAHSEVVYDTPENRLKKAENYVEPVGNLASVYSDTMLNIWGLPLIKKGFRIGNKLFELELMKKSKTQIRINPRIFGYEIV